MTTSSKGIRHEIELFWIAVQFLTRVPVPRWVGFSPDWLTTCVRHFPLVGAGIGLFGATVLWLGALFWPAWVAALLAVGATAWLTCAFHEDGLADSCDALMGVVSRDKALAIMKDSRIGTYGTVGLLVVVGLRVALVAAVAAQSPALACAVMVASHALARAASVVLMVLLPYGGDPDHAKAKPLALDVPASLAWYAAAWSCLLVFMPGLALERLGLAVLALGAWVLWVRGMLMRRLGGFTGDTLGATEQVGEVVVWLCFLAAWP
jgi:adenosylcobinamide-GDP ribazoletransferase